MAQNETHLSSDDQKNVHIRITLPGEEVISIPVTPIQETDSVIKVKSLPFTGIGNIYIFFSFLYIYIFLFVFLFLFDFYFYLIYFYSFKKFITVFVCFFIVESCSTYWASRRFGGLLCPFRSRC